MARLTANQTMIPLLLLLLAIISALGVVASQHKARKLFMNLQQEKERALQMEIEWGQLQLEQSTWAMHARVEKIARERLHMSVPDTRRTQVVVPRAAPGGISGGGR